MKKILLAALAVMLLFAAAACTPNDDTDQTADTADQTADAADQATDTATDDSDVQTSPDADADEDTDTPAAPIPVATLAGPTGMGMVQMLDNDAYDISILTSPDQITPKIINGEVSAAAVPSNLAAVLYNKLGTIKVVAVNTTGVLYILENGDTVSSIDDLAGKTIYATGQGATPEYALNKILAENGLDDVNVEYMGAHADLANALAAGDVSLALLPEPFVSVVLAKNSDISVKIDINQEWQKIYGDDAAMPMGVLVVSSELAEDKDAMDQLIADYSASVDYVVSDIEAASEDIAAAGIIASPAVAASAIPRCGISFVTGDACKNMLAQYFDVMHKSDPDSIGGALPDDGFYYMP